MKNENSPLDSNKDSQYCHYSTHKVGDSPCTRTRTRVSTKHEQSNHQALNIIWVQVIIKKTTAIPL